MVRRTKTQSAQTRERILDAAEIEMGTRGVGQTSLDTIARRADVTRGAIYWHFTDKSALLQAMLARTHMPLRDLRQCLRAHIPGNHPVCLLREMLLHGLKRLATDEQHRRVCHIVLHRCEITADGHPTATLLRAIFEDARAVVFALSEEIADAGRLHPDLTSRNATDTIMAFISGQYECALRHPDLYDCGPHQQVMVDALLRGLFTRADSTA